MTTSRTNSKTDNMAYNRYDEIFHRCSLSGICGGCTFCDEKTSCQKQLDLKEQRVREAVGAYLPEGVFEGVIPSPMLFGYRNKMEYSFGDAVKDGPLTLGLHKKKSFYDVIDADCCSLVHEDCNRIVRAAGDYFRELGLTYCDKRSHLGYLRHLLIRRAVHTGEMLIDLVTTTQPLIPVGAHGEINRQELYDAGSFEEAPGDLSGPEGEMNPGAVKKKRRQRGGWNFTIRPGAVTEAEGVAALSEEKVLQGFTDCLLSLQQSGALEGSIRGILHTDNDALSDAVRNDGTTILYGEGQITEELLGLRFNISPFSFFQTNTKGAELLYSKVREYIGGTLGPEMRVFDLYSGTGTIAQMIAPSVREVTGVEIVPEAVEAARDNACINGLSNCRFIADDVLHALDTLDSPDVIILDPPRDGVQAKALEKIIAYGVANMVYVSCKPESLGRDLQMLDYAGYKIVRACAVDQFPWTDNVETIALLRRAER